MINTQKICTKIDGVRSELQEVKKQLDDLQVQIQRIQMGKLPDSKLPRALREPLEYLREVSCGKTADEVARHFKISRQTMCKNLNNLLFMGYLRSEDEGLKKLFLVNSP